MRKLDKYNHHFISLKFLTAILMALGFAFLLIYAFIPKTAVDYQVYNFTKAEIADYDDKVVFEQSDKNEFSLNTAAKKTFESELKERSFEIIAAAKDSVLSVVTSRYIEKINGLRELENLKLAEFKAALNSERERLLQQRRKELEKNLSEKLQIIRRQVREEYSDFSQQQIRDNYLKMINLRVAIEVVAVDQAEKEKYQKQLQEVRQKQEKLLAEKSSLVNKDISKETRELIMDFNKKYSTYRKKLRSNDQQLIAEKEEAISSKMTSYRKEIIAELNREKNKKAGEMDDLIAESKKYYR